MTLRTHSDCSLQVNLGRSFSSATAAALTAPAPSSSLAAAAPSPPSLALTFSGLKYCCASMNESNDFSHIERVATTPMMTRVTTYHNENESTNPMYGRRGSSVRGNATSYKIHYGNKLASLSLSTRDAKDQQENLMQRRNIDPLSPISVQPESPNYGRVGLVGVTYIKSKSSSITTPVESNTTLFSKSPPRRGVLPTRSGNKKPTSSIESKKSSMSDDAHHDRNAIKIPLAKHDRYDAAIEAYRRRHRGSSLAWSEHKNSTSGQSPSAGIKPPSTANTTVDVAVAAASIRGRATQVRTNDVMSGTVTTNYSASTSSFPQRAIQSRVEIIEMQKRKSRSVSLSRTTSKSSKSDTTNNMNLQSCRPGRSITRQNKAAKHVCNDNDGTSTTRSHRMPPHIQADSSAIMRQQQKQQAVGRSNKSPRARSLSLPKQSTTSKQTNNNRHNLSLTKSCSFTNNGEGKQLSRFEIRKARAREGRHRMVA
jgi:hypothetical protein